MKILQVITQGEHGGAQTYVRDVARFLDRSGHEVHVVTGQQSEEKDRWLFQELQQSGFADVRLHVVDSLIRNIKPLSEIRAGIALYKLFRKTRPDVVHLHSSKVGTIGSVIAWAARVPAVVYTVHGFVFLEPMSRIKKTFFLVAEWLAGWFRSLTITVSQFDLDQGRKKGIIRSGRGIVMRNSIDPDQIEWMSRDGAREYFAELTGDEVIAQNKTIVIGTLANFYPAKGLVYFVQSIALLIKRLPANINLRVVICGDGELRKDLEVEIQKHNLRGIVYLPGRVAAASRYLRAFDAVILSSVKEGFPYIFVESLAAGVPFISTAVGGLIEMQSYVAEMVPSHNPEALAVAIEKVILGQDSHSPIILPRELRSQDNFEQLVVEYGRLIDKN